MNADNSDWVREVKAKARAIAVRARARNSPEDLKSAHSAIVEAIGILENAMREKNAPKELVHAELADLYGMQGQILRRLGREGAALRSFDGGRIYANLAEDGELYNHTQVALSLWLESDQAKDEPELHSKLQSTLIALERDALNIRRNDIWIFSDLGLLYLLNGQYANAESAFHQYERIGGNHDSNSAICNILAKIWVKATGADQELASCTKHIFLELGGSPERLVPHPKYHSCFISFDSDDKEFASQLHAELQDHGVLCWFAPSNVKIGDRVRSAVEDAIRLHDKLILVLSQHSIESDYVEYEANQALEREANSDALVLFPIRIDDAVLQVQFGWAKRLREAERQTGRHIGDFTGWTVPETRQNAFARLLRDLRLMPSNSPA